MVLVWMKSGTILIRITILWTLLWTTSERDYTFDVTCQGSVPQALEAFLESENFEDAIRNAISIGGDSDTIACYLWRDC